MASKAHDTMTNEMDKTLDAEVRALLFDFNGVIVNDEPIHFEATKRVLGELGIRITPEEYETEFLGRNDHECLHAAVHRHQGHQITPPELKEIVDRKSRCYLDLVRNDPPFVAGAVDFIKEASSRFSLAIVSGALRREILHNLKAGDLSRFFPVIISADDVTSSKPDPEGLNRACPCSQGQANRDSRRDRLSPAER